MENHSRDCPVSMRKFNEIRYSIYFLTDQDSEVEGLILLKRAHFLRVD